MKLILRIPLIIFQIIALWFIIVVAFVATIVVAPLVVIFFQDYKEDEPPMNVKDLIYREGI